MKAQLFGNYFTNCNTENSNINYLKILEEVPQELVSQKEIKRNGTITILKNIVLAVYSNGMAELFVGADDEDFHIKDTIDNILGDLLSVNVNVKHIEIFKKISIEVLNQESLNNLEYMEFANFDLGSINKNHSLYPFLLEWNSIYYSEYLTLCFLIDFLNYYSEEDKVFNIQTFLDVVNISKIKIPHYKVSCPKPEFDTNSVYNEVGGYIPRKSNEFKPLFNNYFENNNKSDFVYYYEATNIPQIMLALLYECIKRERKLKKCENCGRLFMAIKSDEKYCSRINNNKSCKQVAKAALRKPSNVTRKYNSINTLLANRINKPNITKEDEEKYRNELFDFRDTAKTYKQKLKSNEMSEADFLEWLDSYKKIK